MVEEEKEEEEVQKESRSLVCLHRGTDRGAKEWTIHQGPRLQRAYLRSPAHHRLMV